MPVMPRTFCFCNDPLPTITCRCESHSLYRVEPVRGYPSTEHILVVHGGLRTFEDVDRTPQHRVYHSALRASTYCDYHTYSHTYATAIDFASPTGW